MEAPLQLSQLTKKLLLRSDLSLLRDLSVIGFNLFSDRNSKVLWPNMRLRRKNAKTMTFLKRRLGEHRNVRYTLNLQNLPEAALSEGFVHAEVPQVTRFVPNKRTVPFFQPTR